MALRLKKAVPEFEDVDGDDDEPQWITYTAEKPNMDIIGPMLKTAEAMVDPTKGGAYYLKLAGAKKLIAALGEGWGIEANRIAKLLPFAVEWHYTLPDQQYREYLWQRMRDYLEKLTKKAAGIKGMYFFSDGKRPEKLKDGWLYIGLRKNSDCPKMTYRCMGDSITPTAIQKADAPEKVYHGIPDDQGGAHIAYYAPQVIYVRCFDNNYYYANWIASAIKNGAQLAMAFVGGAIKLDAWLKDGVEQHKQDRKGLLEKEQAKVEKQTNEIDKATATIRAAIGERDLAEASIAVLKQEVTPEAILKQYPLLADVRSVNRDDPSVTVVQTNDVIVGDAVNLGEYTVNIHHTTPRVHIVGKNKPEDIVHPNIYQEKDKWTWDLSKDALDALIRSLAANRVHQATAIVLANLHEVRPGEGYGLRLKQIADYQKAQEEKRAAKKEKKVIVKEEPKVEEIPF